MKPKKDVGTLLSVCLSRARDAKDSKTWIKVLGEWYTPEEFERYCRSIKNRMDVVFGFEVSDIMLIDPISAIRSGRKHLDDQEKKLLEFTEKVLRYYRKGPSDYGYE